VGSPGDVLADRYLVISQCVVLDRKPGLLPQSPDIGNFKGIKPYLRLIAYRLNVPQVYGILPLTQGDYPREILLLEQPPLSTDSSGLQVQLCSQLNIAWRNATSMRQLNWLWQMANLWQPLQTEGVAISLIDPHIVRVEGSLVRLLELRSDTPKSPDLPDLGKFWQTLQLDSKPAIAEFVHQISNLLIEGKINSPEVLIAVLDQGLATLARSQTTSIKIVTKTDTGPSRQRNEDACYPASGTVVSKPPQVTECLAIVCDGIGGHQGGNVASNLAIETIHQQVQELTILLDQHIEPALVLADLDRAVAIANDKISQRNDNENRQARQRMGTTVVMALTIAHQMYITHVGDSRAYWITRQGCYQVTLDDDVASREVRLGYAIYREAVQQGGAGSLVQALGMSPSHSLHPSSQRFILDEDAIFLLTSDGLSDFDRIEDYWETEILPILTGEDDIVQVADKLVELANTKNGHDNVTLALIHYKIEYYEPKSTITAVIPDISALISANTTTTALTSTLLDGNNNQKTKVMPETRPTTINKLPFHLIVPFLLVILAGSGGYLMMQWREQPTASNPVLERSLKDLAPGWVIKTEREITGENQKTLPINRLLQVIDTKPNPQQKSQDLLVHLRLCTAKTTSPGDQNFWVELSKLEKVKVSVLPPNPENPCPPISNPTRVPNQLIDSNQTQLNTR
jgi:protein phosphatase